VDAAMNIQTLNRAIAEAERFLESAREVQQQAEHTDWIWVQGTRFTGACKRASMDLTRALSDLRRPS
jgi:hypothetical protein